MASIFLVLFVAIRASLSALGVGYKQDLHTTMCLECIGENSAEVVLHEPYLIANACDAPNDNRSM